MFELKSKEEVGSILLFLFDHESCDKETGDDDRRADKDRLRNIKASFEEAVHRRKRIMILPGSSFDSADKIGECRSSVFRNDVVISFHGRPNAIPIGGTIGISFIDQCGLGEIA